MPTVVRAAETPSDAFVVLNNCDRPCFLYDSQPPRRPAIQRRLDRGPAALRFNQ